MKFIHLLVLPQKNENGFALISTLLILVLLTFIGISGTSTTIFELKIAGNEREANQRFYTADSGWKQSGPFLNAMAAPPRTINLTLKTNDTSYDWTDEYYQIVRNYGDGTDGLLNDSFDVDARDGIITNVPYWYRVRYESDRQALQFGAGYRDFRYEVKCIAEDKTQVETSVTKVFRVGY